KFSKPLKKESRTKTPPDKKKVKAIDEPTPQLQEEPEKIEILQGDDIHALAIKQEDLEKLHPPRPPKDNLKVSVTSRVLVRKQKPKEEDEKKIHVVVARPTAPQSDSKPFDYSGPGGPCFDALGQILPHSILGNLEDFKQEALAQGNDQVLELIPDNLVPESKILYLEKYEEKQKPPRKVRKTFPVHQNHALENWKYHMAERNIQQQFISKLLLKPIEQLVMNRSEGFRQRQEQCHLIDRTIPAIDYGKGYRVGSEFWNLPQTIGDDVNGIMISLTQTERGFPPPITHIGKPQTVCQESGEVPPQNSKFHHTWEDSLFLKQRREELKDLLKELDFNQPDIDALEVIGRGQPFTSVSVKQYHFQEENESEGKENGDLLDNFPDVITEPIIGPSIRFCEQPARWNGSTNSHEGEVGIVARVTFETLVEDKATSYLDITNDGTTVVFYDWKRLARPKSFEETVTDFKVQRFYFNISGGVILPGDTAKFSFMFKSPNAGIFSESWEFSTHPVLLGGASLQLKLRGVAIYEDKMAEVRRVLEKELKTKEALATAEQILEELVKGVRTPKRPRSPINAYITEEEIFQSKNPQLYFQHPAVQNLKDLWNQWLGENPEDTEIKDHDDTIKTTEKTGIQWNLSITDFKQAVFSIPVEETQDELLEQLNKTVLELSEFQIQTQEDSFYHICYQLWQETMDNIVSYSMLLRQLLGMPEKNVTGEFLLDETIDAKKIAKIWKCEKEDKKAPKDDKKGGTGKEKEEKKGGKLAGKDKKERPNSRRLKTKEEKKSVKIPNFTKESKEASISGESFEPEEIKQDQVDPLVKGKYQEMLYIEVYRLLSTMVENMTMLFEEVKKNKADCGEQTLL
uniref:MYCBP associated protein n=1 Tax=Latimeria chalumnae TaxID=7897 RepID=H3B2Z4_LATCH